MLMDSHVQKLERLNRFHDCGALNDEDYNRELVRLQSLSSDPVEPDPDPDPDPNEQLPEDEDRPA